MWGYIYSWSSEKDLFIAAALTALISCIQAIGLSSVMKGKPREVGLDDVKDNFFSDFSNVMRSEKKKKYCKMFHSLLLFF